MWDNVNATQKQKTSWLCDNNSRTIKSGTGARDMYLGCEEDQGWKLFERFKMSLYGMYTLVILYIEFR